MNYLLYGADTYRSRRKLLEIIAEYRRKNAGGGFHFYRFDAAEDDLKELRAAVYAGALFTEKKFIVLERPCAAARQCDVVDAVLAETHKKSDVLLVVWDEALGAEGKKRLKRTEKYFDKTQEFILLSGVSLQRWVRIEAGRRGVALSVADAAALCALGPDLWMVVNEMEKIAVGGSAEQARVAPTVFDLGDTFFSSPRDARRILLSLLRAGEDEMRLFAYLAGHARVLLIVKSYMERGMAVPAAAKLHPFVVKKTSRIAGMFPRARFVRTLSRFLDEDRRIKTGVSTARESLLRMLNA